MQHIDSFDQASKSLQKILAEIEPFVKRPVVREHITRGKWNKGEQSKKLEETWGTNQNDEPLTDFLLDQAS